MKRPLLFTIILLVTAGLIAGGIFYYQNLRGAWTALKPVDDLPNTSNTSTTSTPIGQNPTTTTSTKPNATPVAQSNAPFTLPDGFFVSTFAKGIGNPRVIIFDNSGTMLASITGGGKVVALPDKNNDGKADRTVTVLQGLNRPHGLAVRCPDGKPCELYVAEPNAVSVYEYDATNYKATKRKKLIDLPSGGGHSTRTLLLTKENNEDLLLISIGSSCNVCREANSRRATIVSYNLATKKSEIYAKGLRNSVFMTHHPETGKVWATEMGRDYLGDNNPPEEINIIEKGKNYGWPICYGKNIHDTNFDKNTYVRNPCMEPFETPSYIDMQAHSAPLGLAFIPNENWPSDYQGDLLVAFHGSWNRSVPTGYKVVRIKLDANGNYQGIEDFMTGFVKGSRKYGRPAGVAVQGDSIYIGDDNAGIIYRIEYREK